MPKGQKCHIVLEVYCFKLYRHHARFWRPEEHYIVHASRLYSSVDDRRQARCVPEFHSPLIDVFEVVCILSVFKPDVTYSLNISDMHKIPSI